MTREEARKTIDDILACFGNKPGDGTYELSQLDAKDMREAIQALSAEPCEDCISRLDTLMVMKIMMGDATVGDGDNDYATLDDFKQQYIEIVKGMAPVTSQPKIGIGLLNQSLEDAIDAS